MKNFKKLLLVAAPVMLLASCFVFATTYSNELQGAYDYAYGIGITTQTPIDNANIFGTLIREDMAKMMTSFAEEVLGKTPDTSLACNFTDVGNETTEMQGYITEACQLGLMGQGITAFNPKGIVTRAQFGTVLSRAFYGDAYNGGDPYYVNHLNALKTAGIMNDISTPNAPEMRGRVMLMLQRAAGNVNPNPTICDTPENQLSCSLGLDTCPAQCQTTPEVKAGTLNVSLDSASPVNGTQIPSTGTIRFAVVDFAASSSDVSLKTIELTKLGLAPIPSTTRVWFEKDGIRVSGKAAFTSDGKAILSFAPEYVVKAGGTEKLDLYVQLATYAGQDFQFASDSIASTAQNTNGSFTTPTLRTANYTVAPVDVKSTSNDTSYTDISNKVELGSFSVTNNNAASDTRDVAFDSITLRQGGTADLTSLSNITLERNGQVVASNPVINSRDITFSVNDTVKDGTTATYYIKAMVNDVQNQAGDTYVFSVRNTTDVNVSEVTTAFRSTVTLNTLTTALTLHTYTVQGGDLTFARDTSVPLSMNYAAGSQVVLMKGTITAKNSVTLEDISALGFTGTYTGNDLSKMFSTIYLQIGNSTFSYSPTSGDTTAAFLGTATINGTAQVKMYATLKDTAGNRYVKFNDLKLSSFTTKTYTANGNDVTTSGVGSIAGIQVTAQAATLNVTKTDGLGNTNLAAGSTAVTVYGLRLTSTQGNGVTVSNMIFNVAGANTGFWNNAYATLYINGAAIQSKTINAATVTFDGFTKTLNPTTPMDVLVKVDFVDAFSAGTFQVTLNSLAAYDTMTSDAITGYAKPAGAVFTIQAAQGTLAASNSNPLAQLLLSPSSAQQLVAFKLTAANDGVRLYDVAGNGTGLSALSNFRLTDTSGNVIATATTTTSTGVVFSQISNAPVVAQNTSASYYIIADVNTSTNTGPVSLAVLKAGTDIKGSNGNTLAVTGSNVAGNNHAISENIATLAMLANPSKALTTSALRFSVTAAGKDSVLLTGLRFTNALAGYTGTILVTVYKTSIAGTNVAGQAALTNGVAQTIVMTGNGGLNSSIDAGSTVNYIVAIEGALVDPVSNSQDWSVTLNDAFFGGIGAASYTNLGALPFTSTK